MLPIESIIEHYGYLAIGVGTFFEGETILILGGFLAHRGYLALHWVILAAFLGSLSGDQLLFFLGKRNGPFVLGRLPSWHDRVERVNAKLLRYQSILIFGFRFIYGFRTVTPFALGVSRVPARKFVLLNSAGALVWASAVGTGGYLFGHALEAFLGDVKRYELEVMAGIAIIGAILWSIHVLKKRRGKNSSSGNKQAP